MRRVILCSGQQNLIQSSRYIQKCRRLIFELVQSLGTSFHGVRYRFNTVLIAYPNELQILIYNQQRNSVVCRQRLQDFRG